MKTEKISAFKLNYVGFKKQPTKPSNEKRKNTAIFGSVLLGSAFLGVLTYKIIMGRSDVSKIYDVGYKKALLEALKKEGINCKIDDLKSVVGKEEFLELIRKFKPEHFQSGMQTSKSYPLSEFYKNSVNGDFRVSLHTHSNFSDGKATPEEFLECARKYAQKVKKMGKKDNIPFFTIALSDHDNIEGTKEIIRLIAKNPKKYEDLKFVPACELSVRSFLGCHDLTAHSFNPFDEDLNKMLLDLKNKRTRTIQEFLKDSNRKNNTKVTIEDLSSYEINEAKRKNKIGKKTIENGAGVVYVRHAIKFYSRITKIPIDERQLNHLGEKDILLMEKVIETIKNAQGTLSLTHPLKTFWGYIGDDNLLKLKNMGIEGIEVNHQYTPSKIQEIGKKAFNTTDSDWAYQKLTKQYYEFAKKNDMFMSGGTDCHEKQIFSREPKITQEFLDGSILN